MAVVTVALIAGLAVVLIAPEIGLVSPDPRPTPLPSASPTASSTITPSASTRPSRPGPIASASASPSPWTPIASSNGAPLDGPSLTANDENANFSLSMTLDHDRYRAGQPIRLTTTLFFGGPQAKVILWRNSDPGLVGFDVVQQDGPLSMLGGGTTDCVAVSMTKGQAQAVVFSKIGGWSNDDRYAAFYEDYYRDPQLRLPAGTWRISSKSGFSIGGTDCGTGETADLRATVEIVVEP